MDKQPRKTILDAYRCALMFGICLLHAVTQGGYSISMAANLLSWCVTGFAFISGWFGMRFSLRKVLVLYLTSIYCSVAFVAFDKLLMSETTTLSIQYLWSIAFGQWYLNAYIVLMCITPLVNMNFEFIKLMPWDKQKKIMLGILLPLWFCVCVWAFGTTLPFIGKYLPSTSGLNAYSFLTLLCAYVTARMVRIFDNQGKLIFLKKFKKQFVAVLVGAFALMSFGFNDYNSPCCFIVSFGVLFLIKDGVIPNIYGKICLWIAPSMFSIYLLHSHGYAWKYF